MLLSAEPLGVTAEPYRCRCFDTNKRPIGGGMEESLPAYWRAFAAVTSFGSS
jgi:hypothetical protein